jgi:hypothetical protein
MSELVEKIKDAIDGYVREWVWTAEAGWDEEKTAELAARAALAVVLEELREFDVEHLCGNERMRPAAMWRAVLFEFEKEQAGG